MQNHTAIDPGSRRSTRRSRGFFVLSVLSFRITLDLCYIYYLADKFLDDPITPMPLNVDPAQLAISYLLLLPVALLVPHDKKNLNGIFFLAALAFLYVPMTSMIGLNAEKDVTMMLIVCFAVLVSLGWIALPNVRLPMLAVENGPRAAYLLSIGFVAVFVAWSIISGAIHGLSMSLTDIYLHREDSSSVLDAGAMAYVNLWAQKVFNPFLLAIGLFYRRRALVLVCLALQAYFFAVTQHRTHLFVPVLVFLVYLLYSRPFRITHIYYLMSLSLAGVLMASLYFDLDDLPAIVLRRAFFVAPSVTYDWIDYFKANPHVYFADNLLRNYIASMYTGENLPSLMSQLVFSGKEFGFNVGLVGAGYAQLGMAGVFLYATLVGLFVWLANGLIRRGLPVFIAAAVLFDPLRTAWADSDVFTAILSHGILAGLVLIWVYGGTARRRPIAVAAA
jgi:hypothetical protein